MYDTSMQRERGRLDEVSGLDMGIREVRGGEQWEGSRGVGEVRGSWIAALVPVDFVGLGMLFSSPMAARKPAYLLYVCGAYFVHMAVVMMINVIIVLLYLSRISLEIQEPILLIPLTVVVICVTQFLSCIREGRNTVP